MKTNILTTALALSDHDLLARLEALAGQDRVTSAEIVGHLAALEMRPALYAAQGYGSLFGYCTQALRLSEDSACNRIAAARACRRFPAILDLLASGSMTLTGVGSWRPISRWIPTRRSSTRPRTAPGANSSPWPPSWRRDAMSLRRCGGSPFPRQRAPCQRPRRL